MTRRRKIIIAVALVAVTLVPLAWWLAPAAEYVGAYAVRAAEDGRLLLAARHFFGW